MIVTWVPLIAGTRSFLVVDLRVGGQFRHELVEFSDEHGVGLVLAILGQQFRGATELGY